MCVCVGGCHPHYSCVCVCVCVWVGVIHTTLVCVGVGGCNPHYSCVCGCGRVGVCGCVGVLTSLHEPCIIEHDNGTCSDLSATMHLAPLGLLLHSMEAIACFLL